jgi:LysM repeat protein
VPFTRLGKILFVALATLPGAAVPASAAVPHTVVPGETLWSIAASNNLTTRTVATFNGLSEDSQVYEGQTIEIPSEAEGAATLAAAGTTSATPESSIVGSATTQGTASGAIAPADEPAPYWTSPVYCPSCPSGEAYLASNAAANWDAMRQESLNTYGVDLYPAGPLSAYRSYGQQLYLYDLYLSGEGALAAPPGTSAHEYGSAIDLADPAMADVIDQIGAAYGWAKTEASSEWWHVNYVGP